MDKIEAQAQNEAVKISFSQGTLLLENVEPQLAILPEQVRFDERVMLHRAPAYLYAPIVLALRSAGIPYEDRAKNFKPLPLGWVKRMSPLPHQQESLEAWKEAGFRGVVVLPTGAGKSYLAMMGMAHLQRPSLVVVPTIDLMQQWASRLEEAFGCPVGLLGGGSKDIRELTVTTYDSAVLQMEFIGDRFGLIVFDECHHLPGPVNRLAALMSIAPYRLGLSATPERGDGGEELLYELVGPLVHYVQIGALKGSVLAPYKTVRMKLPLEADEADEYAKARSVYTDFLRRNALHFTSQGDWQKFIGLCARRSDGREAFSAYLSQRRIARQGRAKFTALWELLRKHRGERIIIFTAENETAYEIGERFLLPVLTHHTKVAERKDFLDKFRSGAYPVLVTSKVLNEGVDVPEASVGVIVSGSACIREHVQRLGRLLRAQKGKTAMLYELLSEGTSEIGVSERRRQHHAYQRTHKSQA